MRINRDEHLDHELFGKSHAFESIDRIPLLRGDFDGRHTRTPPASPAVTRRTATATGRRRRVQQGDEFLLIRLDRREQFRIRRRDLQSHALTFASRDWRIDKHTCCIT